MSRRMRRRTLGPPPMDWVLTMSHVRASVKRPAAGRGVTGLIASAAGCYGRLGRVRYPVISVRLGDRLRALQAVPSSYDRGLAWHGLCIATQGLGSARFRTL